MAVKELSDYNPDGTRLGQAAADLIGFHGASPTAQVALSATAAIATTAATSAAGLYGFSGAQANGIVALLNAIRAGMVTKGLAST